MGLADCNTVAGVVRAWNQAKQIDDELKQQAGTSVSPTIRERGSAFPMGFPTSSPIRSDRTGWGNLCRMLTVANLRGEKGSPELLREDFFEWARGLNLAVLPDLDAAPQG